MVRASDNTSATISTEYIARSILVILYPGWVYYCISNAMQYSNTAIETTALVMHDSNTFFLCGTTFSYGSVNFINIHDIL